jgi:hypothetical protein
VQIPSNNRTKVGNGARLHVRPKFGGPDMRSREGRRWREVYIDFLIELGRRPAASEQAQIRVATNLTIRVEDMSAALAAGKRIDPGDITMLSSELRRCLRSLGMDGASGSESDADQLRRGREDLEAGLR